MKTQKQVFLSISVAALSVAISCVANLGLVLLQSTMLQTSRTLTICWWLVRKVCTFLIFPCSIRPIVIR